MLILKQVILCGWQDTTIQLPSPNKHEDILIKTVMQESEFSALCSLWKKKKKKIKKKLPVSADFTVLGQLRGLF